MRPDFKDYSSPDSAQPINPYLNQSQIEDILDEAGAEMLYQDEDTITYALDQELATFRESRGIKIVEGAEAAKKPLVQVKFFLEQEESSLG